MYIYIYALFFWGGYGAWGSALHWLLNGGMAHVVATCLILIGWGGLVSGENLFRFPAFFKAKNLLIFTFPLFFFLFSCYFFTFSLRLAFLTSLVVHFALSLLSLLLRLLPIHFMPLKKNVLWKLRFLASSKIDFSFLRGQGSSSQKGWEGLCLCSWGSLFLWGCIFMWP